MTNQNEPTPIYDNVGKPEPVLGPITEDVETPKTSLKPQPKVIAATIGAPVGVAVSEVGIWFVETVAKIDIPSNIEAAITIIVASALAFVAGYFKKN